MWSPTTLLNPPQLLFGTYLQCQSDQRAFVLGVGPAPSGNIPKDQLDVLRQMKNLIANPPPATPAYPQSTTPAANATNLKYGLYIHFGMDTFRREGEKGQLPVERFAPGSVNARAWAHAAKEAGMAFAILTAKHESGFCLWDSQGYDYDIAYSPFKGDLLAGFIAACKAEGILPGVHYSIPDALNEGSIRYKGVVPPPYFNVIKQHITELNTKYPKLRIILLDVSERLSPSQLEELGQIVQRINPQCALWNTTGGDKGPHHVAATVIRSWFWAPNAQLKPAPILFSNYQQCQAAGKTFVLNVGPDLSGNIPNNQLAVLMQIKDMIAGDSNH
jgi:alpha-L-fucosidase